jgi:hypothetical protein
MSTLSRKKRQYLGDPPRDRMRRVEAHTEGLVVAGAAVVTWAEASVWAGGGLDPCGDPQDRQRALLIEVSSTWEAGSLPGAVNRCARHSLRSSVVRLTLSSRGVSRRRSHGDRV